MTSLYKEAVARRCSVRKMFLKMSQNSQEDTCARVFFLIKLKKRLWHRCFFVNFTKLKILKTFFIEHLRWLILYIKSRLFIVGNKTQWFISFSTIYFKEIWCFIQAWQELQRWILFYFLEDIPSKVLKLRSVTF